jgi:hypothetical protein
MYYKKQNKKTIMNKDKKFYKKNTNTYIFELLKIFIFLLLYMK